MVFKKQNINIFSISQVFLQNTFYPLYGGMYFSNVRLLSASSKSAIIFLCRSFSQGGFLLDSAFLVVELAHVISCVRYRSERFTNPGNYINR